MRFSTFGGPGAVVKGAPYSATITNESVQTLADGTRIVQSSDGSAARDSQGRTRQDAPLPMIGGLAASDAPHLVMIQDPVANVGYTLNLTDKTAWKHAIPAGRPGMAGPRSPRIPWWFAERPESLGQGPTVWPANGLDKTNRTRSMPARSLQRTSVRKRWRVSK